MRNFSVYRFLDKSFTDVVTTVNTMDDWAELEIDPITDEKLQFEFTKHLTVEEKIDETDVKAMYLEFRSAKLSDKNKYSEDYKKRVRRNDSDIIVFEVANDVIIIPLRGKNFTTGSLIRTAFNIKEDNQLINEDFSFKEDFFYWMFNHYLNNSGKIVNSDLENRELRIKSLTGFSGQTRDTVNKITSDGNRISKILWTLAFLFTNEKLMSITPELQHLVTKKEGTITEVIKLDLTLTGTYKVGITDHIGTRFMEKDTISALVYLVLYTYMILVPELQKAYENGVDKESWSPHVKKQFITSIGSEIEDQVSNILEEIENELGEDA